MSPILVPVEEKDAELLIVALKMSSVMLVQLRHICQGEPDIQRMINIQESTAKFLKHNLEWRRTKRAMEAETEERKVSMKPEREVSMKKAFRGEDSKDE